MKQLFSLFLLAFIIYAPTPDNGDAPTPPTPLAPVPQVMVIN